MQYTSCLCKLLDCSKPGYSIMHAFVRIILASVVLERLSVVARLRCSADFSVEAAVFAQTHC